MKRSHPGDVTQTVNQICCGLTTDMLRGLPSPPREERGGCAGARGLRWQVRCWGRCGSEQPYPHACVPDWMTSSPAICSPSPLVCRSHSQLFAVQPSSYLQSLPTYLQPYPQECAITTPAARRHHRYLQSPPQLFTVTLPAVCSYHPRLSIISPQLFAVTNPVIRNLHPSLGIR